MKIWRSGQPVHQPVLVCCILIKGVRHGQPSVHYLNHRVTKNILMASYVQLTLLCLVLLQLCGAEVLSPHRDRRFLGTQRNIILASAYRLLQKVKDLATGRKIQSRQDLIPFDPDPPSQFLAAPGFSPDDPDDPDQVPGFFPGPGGPFPGPFPGPEGPTEAPEIDAGSPTTEGPTGPRFMRRFRTRLGKVRETRQNMAVFGMCSMIYTIFCGMSFVRDVALNKYCIHVPMEFQEHCIPK